MKKRKYITDTEHKKCQEVANIFSMLEEDDIISFDAGKYGFVVLLYYTPPHGFEALKAFTDSQKMCDFLWLEWLESQLIRMAEAMGMDDLDYEDFFRLLPEETRNGLLNQRKFFQEKAGL